MSTPTVTTQLAEANAQLAEAKAQIAALQQAREADRRQAQEDATAAAELEIERLRDQLAAASTAQQERDDALGQLREVQAHPRSAPPARDPRPVDQQSINSHSEDTPWDAPRVVPHGELTTPTSLQRMDTELSDTLSNNPSKPRRPFVKAPDTYSGDRDQFRRFKASVRLNLTARKEEFRNDQERILFVASYLQESPLDWFSREFWGKNPPHWSNDLETFLHALEDLWGARGKDSEARIALKYLEQGSLSVSELYEQFRSLCYEANIDPETMADDFRHKLSYELQRDMIARGPQDPIDLHGWYLLAKRFEDRRLEFAAEQTARRKYKQVGTTSTSNRAAPRQRDPEATLGRTTTMVRQTTVARTPGPATPRVPVPVAAKRCYQCGQVGHLQRDCKSPPRQPTTMAYIETTEEDEDKDEDQAKN